MRRFGICILISYCLFSIQAKAQTFSIKGIISQAGGKIPFSVVGLESTSYYVMANDSGSYILKGIKPGKYILSAAHLGYKKTFKKITLSDKDLTIDLQLNTGATALDSVVITAEKEKTFGIARLKDVDGVAIYAGKKSEVIVMSDITANTSTNNSRQIYSKIAGLNIWESDGAGIQLGIGGRGLNPNRVTNFNTRQNGYDMSADALGYPESYYSPPTEAVDRIEIVRGAASLQYGTQFGGLVNFKLKKGAEDKKIEVTSRTTGGSWGFLNSFNSIGGTVKKVNYYVFYQHKSGDGWRPNSQFNVNTAYASMIYKVNEKLSFTVQYTFMEYLAHQPGGLTDAMFAADPRQSVRDRNWFKVNWNLGAFFMDYKLRKNLTWNTRVFGLSASRSALGILTFINRADPMGPRDLWIDNYNNYGAETRLLYNYSIKGKPSTLLVGYRFYSGFTNRSQGLGNDASTGTPKDFTYTNPNDLQYSKYSFPNINHSVFAENIIELTSKLSLIPGIRVENIRTVADGFYTIANTDLAGNLIYDQKTVEHRKNSRSFVLGGLGLSYKRSNSLQIYANFSQNYRAINFNDMRVVNPNLQVDLNLKDEKGYSADIGSRGTVFNILNYDVSLFMIEYDNRIGTVLKIDTLTYNIYRLRTNISQSRNVGVESFVEVDFWRLIKGENAKSKISVFSNLAYIDARYINSKEAAYENKKVELAPNLVFKTGLSFKTKKFSATYQYSYTSQQFTDASNAVYTSNAINGFIPAYFVMDFSTEYKLNKFLSVAGSINNLANNMYFTRRADSYPGPGIIPSDGRSFFLTLQIKL